MGLLTLAPSHSTAGSFEPFPDMITVPAGTFEMGGDHDDEAVPDERSDRSIDMRSFSAAQTEVTAQQYDACVRSGACRAPLIKAQGDDYPVTGVSWRDAQSYAAWLSVQTGRHYRLLSEAEWERIARAGTQSRFWWGNDPDRAFGNFGDEDCCRPAVKGPDTFEFVAPVRRFKPTPEGFYDLYGNVWEWTQDCYGNYDHAPRDGSAQEPADCRVRVLRGGSYLLPPGFARASARYRLTPGARRPDVGFRVALDLGAP
ncbi:SUMF1/EgtB/PvdO family nonheme iron enzyme [Mesorhizobium sp. KR1-2]|uniref:formylglycine-generating enzyme family protein n=1 Tax=Mesorhizobium sp. KR1-2 TaxID=3156609 RepID=UPI0032B53964